MPEPLQPPEALGPELAASVREFLIRLAEDPDLLVEYVRNRVEVLRNESGLSDEAQALLLSDNYPRVSEVMKQASAPVRWLVIWII